MGFPILNSFSYNKKYVTLTKFAVNIYNNTSQMLIKSQTRTSIFQYLWYRLRFFYFESLNVPPYPYY